jgi:hypothetical protein
MYRLSVSFRHEAPHIFCIYQLMKCFWHMVPIQLHASNMIFDMHIACMDRWDTLDMTHYTYLACNPNMLVTVMCLRIWLTHGGWWSCIVSTFNSTISTCQCRIMFSAQHCANSVLIYKSMIEPRQHTISPLHFEMLWAFYSELLFIWVPSGGQ